jgi:hypothetical protein
MMDCERGIATTMTTIASITERGDGDGGDDANYKLSVRKKERKKRCQMSDGKATQQENGEVPSQR